MTKNIILFFVLAAIVACTPKQYTAVYQRTGMVSCISHDDMTITVVAEAQAENIDKAAAFAERLAVENLLFKGIPKSNQERALVSNEAAAKQKNPAFFEDFILNKGYQAYMTESIMEDDYVNGGVHFVKQHIVFDLTNMRRYLEKNSIIGKFGIYSR